MRNINISNFKKDFLSYINQTIKYNEPINVSAKNGNVVVMSEEDYNGMMETMRLLSIPVMRDTLLEGMKVKREDLVEIDWRSELES
jgi:PHD/YefM family antitoxin component YafN of YafNO toxin-antitoxin module